MKHLLIVLALFGVLIFVSPMYAQITFERWYGGVGEDGGCSVAQTSDGGYIVAGYTYSYGAGSRDLYLVKTDSLGDTLWTRTYGGTDWDGGRSVAQTSDGGYIVAGWTWSYGAGSYDVYLIKTDSLGLGIQEEKEQRQVTRDVRFTISPNPFTDKIRINLGMYDVGYRVEDMSLQIYDISGRLVKVLSLLTAYSLLPTELTWDGRDDKGSNVLPGVYFMRLSSGDFTSIKKVILVR